MGETLEQKVEKIKLDLNKRLGELSNNMATEIGLALNEIEKIKKTIPEGLSIEVNTGDTIWFNAENQKNALSFYIEGMVKDKESKEDVLPFTMVTIAYLNDLDKTCIFNEEFLSGMC